MALSITPTEKNNTTVLRKQIKRETNQVDEMRKCFALISGLQDHSAQHCNRRARELLQRSKDTMKNLLGEVRSKKVLRRMQKSISALE